MSADPYGMKTQAVAFAVRAGHTDEMAHRFLELLCAGGLLGQPRQFGPLLAQMMREEPARDEEPTGLRAMADELDAWNGVGE